MIDDSRVNECQQALADASAEVDRINAAVLAGDDTLSGADLVRAEAEVRFAALRLEGTHRNVIVELEALRQERLAELEARLRTVFPDHYVEILEAFSNAIEALEGLSTAVAGHNGTLGQILDQTWDLGVMPRTMVVHHESRAIRLPDLDMQVDWISPGQLGVEALHRALVAIGQSVDAGITAVAPLSMDRQTAERLGTPPGTAHGFSDVLRWRAEVLSGARMPPQPAPGVEQVEVLGQGGAIWTMDVPIEGTPARERFDAQIASGELVVIPAEAANDDLFADSEAGS